MSSFPGCFRDCPSFAFAAFLIGVTGGTLLSEASFFDITLDGDWFLARADLDAFGGTMDAVVVSSFDAWAALVGDASLCTGGKALASGIAAAEEFSFDASSLPDLVAFTSFDALVGVSLITVASSSSTKFFLRGVALPLGVAGRRGSAGVI
jgi:hypothetical protein